MPAYPIDGTSLLSARRVLPVLAAGILVACGAPVEDQAGLTRSSITPDTADQASVQELAKHKGIEPVETRVAVQGFGNAGYHVARLLQADEGMEDRSNTRSFRDKVLVSRITGIKRPSSTAVMIPILIWSGA